MFLMALEDFKVTYIFIFFTQRNNIQWMQLL